MKSRTEILTLPTHQRKREFKKRRNFRKVEAKRTLPVRIKIEEGKKRKIQEEAKLRKRGN